jgi:hypothetical protein
MTMPKEPNTKTVSAAISVRCSVGAKAEKTTPGHQEIHDPYIQTVKDKRYRLIHILDRFESLPHAMNGSLHLLIDIQVPEMMAIQVQ